MYILKVTIITVTLNILKLNGASYNIYHKVQERIQQRNQRHSHIQEPGTRREGQEKNSRREVGYYGKQNRKVQDCWSGESKAKERSKGIRFGIRGALEVSLVGGDKVTLLFN